MPVAVDTHSMDNAVTNNIGDTISIRRPPRVVTDELGHNSWMGEVDAYEFQLETIENFNPYDSIAKYNPTSPALS